MVCLEVALPASAAELAVHLGGWITRTDYLRLLHVELCAPNVLEIASDAVLLERLRGDDNKLAAMRAAPLAHAVCKRERMLPQSILPSPQRLTTHASDHTDHETRRSPPYLLLVRVPASPSLPQH